MSGKLLEKWTTAFKKKVIQQWKKLPNTSDLEELLLAAESPTGDSEEGVNCGQIFKINFKFKIFSKNIIEQII